MSCAAVLCAACVDLGSAVARLHGAYIDKDVVCYFQRNRWRFCYCQHCKTTSGRKVAIRGAKLVHREGSTRCVSDSGTDSERDEWEQKQETIVNLSEYQEGLQRIWSIADDVLVKQKYERVLCIFNDFMTTKMRIKHVFPANGEGASAETNTQEKRKRRW